MYFIFTSSRRTHVLNTREYDLVLAHFPDRETRAYEAKVSSTAKWFYEGK